MSKVRDYICGYASRFVKNNWDKITLDWSKAIRSLDEIDNLEKDFPQLVKNDFDLASWVITEMMKWSMDKDYLTEMIVQDNKDGFIAKFGEDTYIKFTIVTDKNGIFDYFETEFVEPKTKTITYFE